MTQFHNPDQIFFDRYGNRVSLGKVYFGEPSTDPKANPKAPYSDAALTTQIDATQALTDAGKLAQFTYLDGDYSVLCEKANGDQVFLINSLIDQDIKGMLFTSSASNAVSRSVEGKLSDTLSVKDFGALGDGSTDDTEAVTNAVEYAAQNGLALYVPAGTYMLSSSAITTTIQENGSFVLYGDGASSVLKLMDGEVEANYRRILYFNVTNDIESLTVKDVVLDHNARGSTPPASDFDYEQSHSILVNVNETYEAKHIHFDNVILKDPAADGINNVSKGTIHKFTASNCKGIDRTRVRADIQFSRLPLNIAIDNFQGSRIETENLTTLTQDVTVTVSNSIIETLDWAMNSPAGEEHGKLFLNNTSVTSSAFFGSCSLRVNNCDLRLPTDGRWNNLRTSNALSDTRLYLSYDSDTGAVGGFYPYATSHNQDITFNNCKFIIDSLTVPTAPTGFLVQDASALSVANAALYTRQRVFNDCEFDARAERSIDCYRNGTWVLNNCKYGGTDYAIRWLQGSTYYVDLTINGGDFTEVTGDFINGSWTVVDQTTTIAHLKLRGNFYGAASSGVQTSSGAITDAWGLQNTRKIDAGSIPTDGLLNDTVLLNSAAIGEGCEYRCTTASAGGSAAYRLTGQAGISMDITGNRPTPAASDVGLQYLDTTLDADGHLILWNGTAWIDAQGATV